MANKTKELRVVLILTVDESVHPGDLMVDNSDVLDGFDLFRDNNGDDEFLLKDISIIAIEENQ